MSAALTATTPLILTIPAIEHRVSTNDHIDRSPYTYHALSQSFEPAPGIRGETTYLRSVPTEEEEAVDDMKREELTEILDRHHERIDQRLRSSDDGFRKEIGDLRTELSGKLDGLTGEVGKLRVDFTELRTEVHTGVRVSRWMLAVLGAILATVIASGTSITIALLQSS